MKKLDLDFEGSNIHGDKLRVYLKGDGVLSLSFVIEHAGRSSWWLLYLIVSCVLAVVGAVYWELLSLTVSSFVIWTALLLIVICLQCLWYFLNVVRESVFVVKDLGVQFTRSGAFGVQMSQFIEQHRVDDVLITEVVTMHQVVFYLMLLISDGTQDDTSEKNQQLLPLFTSSTPCLETITPIYHGIQQILGIQKMKL